MLMKKFILFFFSMLLCLNIQAQSISTNHYNDESVRYELISIFKGSYQLLLDSQTGILKLIYSSDPNDMPKEVEYINDKDLTNGTETHNGRFRILIPEDWGNKRLLDTTDGRVWIINWGKTSSITLIPDTIKKK